MNQPARTVTATCTRVSRESLVIADPEAEGQFRRLTIRERASLQGFPITFQFYAKSFSEKAKMIGNAIPPTFTYLLALAAGAASSQGFRGFGTAARQLTLPEKPAPVTPPDREGRTYPSTRSFRAAIPGLRFKSGMRFDLSNTIERATAEWRVRFFFGPSKDIREIDLDGTVLADLKRSPVVADALGAFGRALAKAEAALHASSPADLQLVWARKAQGLSPYDVVDLLGALADDLHSRLEAELDRDSLDAVEKYVLTVASGSCAHGKLVGGPKLQRNALRILAGLVIGDWFNTLSWHRTQLAAA
jgi:DNA (cytosine-5)-methyltransferase 1